MINHNTKRELSFEGSLCYVASPFSEGRQEFQMSVSKGLPTKAMSEEKLQKRLFPVILSYNRTFTLS